MLTDIRKIIRIDEDKCNGCGKCIPKCVEGALEIVGGKAKLVSDRYCDGLGACLGHCPEGAISIEERPAEAYDEQAVSARSAIRERLIDFEPVPFSPRIGNHSHGGSCPGARTIDLRDMLPPQTDAGDFADDVFIPSQLRQWPVKLKLLNPAAPYFADAHLVIAADCAPFAFAGFHHKLLAGKALIIVCPKFEEMGPNLQKLTAICEINNIQSITVAHMEVPCCSGLASLAKSAVMQSGKQIPITVKIVGIRGTVD